MSLRDELSLSELIKLLDADCAAVGPAKMRDILERLVISAEEMRVYALFSDNRYARNLVHKTAQFEIMIMCWHAGQRSSIHDHAGSLGGLKILHGALTESLFEKAPNGMIKSLTSIDYAVGASSSRGDIFNSSNLEPSERKRQGDLGARLCSSVDSDECLLARRSVCQECVAPILQFWIRDITGFGVDTNRPRGAGYSSK